MLALEVNDMYFHGMEPWGWLMMLLFWAAIIFVIVWVVRSTGNTPQRDGDSARRILDERFARGEIEREDYEERRRILDERR